MIQAIIENSENTNILKFYNSSGLFYVTWSEVMMLFNEVIL